MIPATTRLSEPPPARMGTSAAPAGGPRRHRLGRAGEDAAARFLSSLGYRILARRYRVRAGEIDLVAEEGGTLVFVEVKTRSSLRWGSPGEAVDLRKRRRMARAAALYLSRVGAAERPCRFDIVEILGSGRGRCRPSLIRNAFEAP